MHKKQTELDGPQSGVGLGQFGYETGHVGDCSARDGHQMNSRRGLLIFIFLVLPGAFPAYGDGAVDLLNIPAKMSPKAAKSMLMDVVDAGGRLVAVGERGHILRSDNGGRDWVQARVPVSVTLTAVVFPTPRKGWAVGHDGVVLHTDDSGQTWRKQIDGWRINEMMLTRVKQMIREKKEKLENSDAAGRQALLLGLDDLDYFLGDAELAVKEGPTRPLLDVWFKNDRQGIVVGAFGVILETTDGGKTWDPIPDRIDNMGGLHYNAIARSGDDLFIAGEMNPMTLKSTLYRSVDFGRTWKNLDIPYEGSFLGVTGSRDGGFVIAYGLRGTVFYSHDRGEHWQRAATASTGVISGGIVFSNGDAFVSGVDGLLMQSVDKGKTFLPLPSRFPGSVSMAGTENGNLVVVGMRGVDRTEPVHRKVK